jgi:GTPase SAR1 family protein
MVISVVGAKDVGKSHYIGVLIQELLKEEALCDSKGIIESLGGRISPFGDTDSFFKTTYSEFLYENRQTLAITRSAIPKKAIDRYQPLIYKVVNHSRLIKPFDLTIFDVAGEDLTDMTKIRMAAKNISNSDGIILLLDPLRMKEVQKKISDEERRGSMSNESVLTPNHLIELISKLIREERLLTYKKVIPIPIAITLSKIDKIISIIDSDGILSESPHRDCSKFCLSDYSNVNNDVRGLLYNWNNQFVDAIEGKNSAVKGFASYSYFAVSALGLNNSPDENGRIAEPRPHRIEDPLLWFMANSKLIKTCK